MSIQSFYFRSLRLVISFDSHGQPANGDVNECVEPLPQIPRMFTARCSYKQMYTFHFAVCELWMIKLCLTVSCCTDRCSVWNVNIHGTLPSVSGTRHHPSPFPFYVSYLSVRSVPFGCTPQNVQLLANASVYINKDRAWEQGRSESIAVTVEKKNIVLRPALYISHLSLRSPQNTRVGRLDYWNSFYMADIMLNLLKLFCV